MLRELTSHWWIFSLRGFLAITFGLLALSLRTLSSALFTQAIATTSLLMLFAFYVLFSGLFDIFVSLQPSDPGWWAWTLQGAVLFWPGITSHSLLPIIGAHAAGAGAGTIIIAMELRKHIADEWMFGLGGVISLVTGLVLLWDRDVSAFQMLGWISSYAIGFGAALVALSVRLHRLNRMGGTV